jgi:hypothetical protein
MGVPNALTENDFAPSSQAQIESAVELAASDLEKGHGDAFHVDGANVNGASTNGADAKANGSFEVVKETGKGKVNVPTVMYKSARRWIDGGKMHDWGWHGPSNISLIGIAL